MGKKTQGDAAFAKHTSTEIFFGTYRAWGLGRPQTSFATRNGARTVEVVYPYQSAIQRDVKTLGVVDLCVHVIAQWTNEMSILGVPVDPSKYSRMTVRIVENGGAGLLAVGRSLGGAELVLRDGRCVFDEGSS